MAFHCQVSQSKTFSVFDFYDIYTFEKYYFIQYSSVWICAVIPYDYNVYL